MHPSLPHFAFAVVLLSLAAPGVATTVSVGSGAGCNHASLQAAFDALDGVVGAHTFRLRR